MSAESFMQVKIKEKDSSNQAQRKIGIMSSWELFCLLKDNTSSPYKWLSKAKMHPILCVNETCLSKKALLLQSAPLRNK